MQTHNKELGVYDFVEDLRNFCNFWAFVSFEMSNLGYSGYKFRYYDYFTALFVS